MHALVLAAVLLSCDGSFGFPDTPVLERLRDSRPSKHAKPVAFDGRSTFYIRKGTKRWRIGEIDRPERVAIRQHLGLWFLSYRTQHKYGYDDRTIILDVEVPKIVRAIYCGHGIGGGMCSAPDLYRFPRANLRCDASLRCTSTETMLLEWTDRTATRTFDLLTNKTIPAEDAAYRVTKNIVAKHARGSAMMVRFFAGSREIPTSRLIDADYASTEYETLDFTEFDDEYSTSGPPLKIRAKPHGNGTYEVLVQEGKGRALFLVNATHAIRIASDAPEYRHCNSFIYPPSVYAPAPGGYHFLPSMRGELVPRCDLMGTIIWNRKDGWVARYAEVPCATPAPWPWRVAIDAKGILSVRPSNPQNY